MRKLKLGLILTLLTGSLACQKAAEPRADINGSSPLQKIPKDQSLRAAVDELYVSQWLEPCDVKLRTSKERVTSTIDSHWNEIQKYAQTVTQRDDFKRYYIGPLLVREWKSDYKPYDVWTNDPFKWSDLEETIDKFQANPSSGAWAEIYSRVGFFLSLDNERLVEGKNMEIGKDSEKQLSLALTDLDECLSRTSCQNLDEFPATKKFLSENSIFVWFTSQIEKSASPTEMREWLKKLRNRVQYDYEGTFETFKSPIVKRISPYVFEVSVNPGELVGQEKELEEKILPYWASERFDLKIKWTPTPPTEQIILGKGLYARSETVFQTAVMTLQPNLHVKTLPHELGHAMGLRDKYFEVWNP